MPLSEAFARKVGANFMNQSDDERLEEKLSAVGATIERRSAG